MSDTECPTQRPRAERRPHRNSSWFIPRIAAASVALWALLPPLAPSSLGFVEGCELVASVATGAATIIGIWHIRSSRLRAYRWFLRAVLVQVFFGQVFAFYRNQFWALFGLGVSIVIWGVLRYMVHEEEWGERTEPGSRDESVATLTGAA